MRLRLASVIACLLSLTAWAHTPDLQRLDSVHRLQLDSERLATQISSAAHEPRRIAVAQTLNADRTAGTWDETPDGQARWRLRVSSPGARSLSFHLQALQLPEQAQLWIYTADGRDAQGPYTVRDNGSLWTPLVRGDEAVIEVTLPGIEREAFSLKVSQAFHGFRALDGSGYPAKGAFGTAGNCTIDVACSDGNNWRNDIRSTVLLTIGSTGSIDLCSGTLVNNTAQNDRALILTANHCGIDSSDVASTRAYFNVQKATCGNSADGPVTENIAGKSVLAKTVTGSNTDYTLFELAGKPPANYDVYYAGWDIGGVAPSSGVGISHPAGDDKKISTYNSPASAQNNQCVGGSVLDGVCSGFVVNAWAVIWTRGTTEGGSSGSGLWNQNHHIVGTLSGGDSECASSTSITNNGGTDLYARLDLAWTATSSTGNTLKQVLDAANSGCTTLDGKDAGSAAAASCGSGVATNSGSGGGSWGLDLLPLLLAGLARHRRCRRRLLHAVQPALEPRRADQ